MSFRTKIDFRNRQVKQFEKTDIVLSGGTVFGLPYSALTSGPDLTTSAVTDSNEFVESTFSGNTGTTVWTFGDGRMSLTESELDPITPSNSGTTQITGPTFTGNTPFTTVDGNSGFTDYTGVTYDMEITEMVDLGGGSYSGTGESDLSVLSASSLDFTGRTIWVDVSGITRTFDLIVSELPSVSDLQTNSEGMLIDGASDIKFKEKIEPINGSLDKILQLKPVSFEWKPEMKLRSGKVFGLIAQDVQNIIPDIVRKRSKGDGLTVEYKELVPWLIKAVQELKSGGTITTSEETIIKTQTIAAEDNNIELNYNGSHKSSIGGGITVLHGIKEGYHSEIKTDENGRWVVLPSLATPQLTLPEYTPSSSNDEIGGTGDVVWDDNHLYIKTNYGWKKTPLERF